jgi:hypothetical protein
MHDPSGRKILPFGQRGGAPFTVGLAIDQVPFRVEMVVQAGVNGGEFL